MSNERGKKKRPAPTASTGGTCLSVVNIGNVPVPNVPRHLHLVNCIQEGMLEFEKKACVPVSLKEFIMSRSLY